MRVADKMNFQQAVFNMNKNRNDLSVYQNQAATQKRITKPSDDPIGAARILESRTDIKGLEQYKKNILSSKEFIEFSEQSLGELTELLIRAKELAVQQSTDGGASGVTRKAVAFEIRQIFDQVVNIGNRKFGDRFLFGGFKTLQAPFDYDGNYYGDDAEIEVATDKEAHVQMNMPGSVVFLGKRTNVPTDFNPNFPVNEFKDLQRENRAELRGPDSLNGNPMSSLGAWGMRTVNIFDIVRTLDVGLEADDKSVLQSCLEPLDDAINQVSLARGELGARVSTLNRSLETLQKLTVDSKALESEIEDVDVFELYNNLNRTQNQLQASLSTSKHLLQSSLLDFLR